jgi:hypothetical protein
MEAGPQSPCDITQQGRQFPHPITFMGLVPPVASRGAPPSGTVFSDPNSDRTQEGGERGIHTLNDGDNAINYESASIGV